MSTNRLVAFGLVLPILVTGLTLATPRKAQADDEWLWALGGLIVGALIASDNDHGDRYYAPPRRAKTYYYPRHRAYVFVPVKAGPRYRPRYWTPAGHMWRGRPVWVPAQVKGPLQGPRHVATFQPGHDPVLKVRRSMR